MKIKITAIVPVGEKNKPILGKVYDVIRIKWATVRIRLFFVEVDGIEVGVYENEECEVVNDE